MNDHSAKDPNAPAQAEERSATGGSEGALAAEGVETFQAPSAPEPAAPATLARKLPKIAEKADDLEAIKKAVDDAAAVGGGLWLSYLFVLFYLAIAAGAVTHADLFFEHSVKLPFLNIELPLLAFFFLAPILFLIVHAYTLVHLVMLADKAKRFDQVLNVQIGDDDSLPVDERARRFAIRTGLQRQLPSNIFVLFLAGPVAVVDVRDSPFGWFIRAIAWVTLVVAPVLLLLLMQIQFLPFHYGLVTWTHRIALVADLVLVWWLWRKILSGREIEGRRRRTHWVSPGFGLALSAAAVLFSWTTATFPGEWQEDHFPDWRVVKASDEFGQQKNASLHDLIFNSKVDLMTRRRWLPFSSTLVLFGVNIYEGLKIDDPEKVKRRDYVFSVRDRDLRGAIFDFASLPKVDFAGANLQGASALRAQLQGASFDRAELQGASLEYAQLQGASLENAQLQGASLIRAQLQGASLVGAKLQGVSLRSAQLQGASLDYAQLFVASLDYAQLQGASLDGTLLQDVSLKGAQLQGASLQWADLRGTDLSDAYLWRTNRAARAPPKAADVKLSDPSETWRPSWWDDKGDVRPWNEQFYQTKGEVHPWNQLAFHDLRKMLESLTLGFPRDQALENISSLDCTNPDPTLASCDTSLPPPPEADAWQESLEHARSTDDAANAKALAAALKAFVCPGDADALYVLRGLLRSARFNFRSVLEVAGPEAPALIDFIMSRDCPVSASLSEDDKANLLRIKQDASKKPGG